MKYILALSTLLISGILGMAQSGGQRTYTFLTSPTSARAAALGGDFISVKDDDLNLVADNPALLDSNLHNHLTLTYINYISDINFGYGSYARHYEGIGTFSLGVQYINYGTFTEADETGRILGEFSAGEIAMDVSYGRSLDSVFSVGGTFKVIYSGLGTYQSYGVAIDGGVHYRSKKKLFQAGLVINNFGVQLKPYVTGNREPLPFEIQLGGSYLLPRAPIRFTLLASNLQQWDLDSDEALEDTPSLQPSGALNVSAKSDNLFTFDKLMRHFVMAAEVLPSENFHLRIGFNYLRRVELRPQDGGGLPGFSFGAGFRIKKIHVNYGLASYHLAGTSHHLSLTANLNEFKSRQ